MVKHSAWALTVAAVLAAASEGVGKIERLDAALDALVVPGTVIEKVAGGFLDSLKSPLWRTWTEPSGSATCRATSSAR